MTKANRNIDDLQPKVRDSLKKVLEEVGDTIFVTEGKRSYERQKYLYAKGRTAPGSKVTRTLKSKHLEGIAVDIAFKGDTLYPPLSDPRRKRVANVFKANGWKWGGDRKKTKDYPHFEYNPQDNMNFYEKLYTDEYGTVPRKTKTFKYPERFIERSEGLGLAEFKREVTYLIAYLMEK